MSNAPQRTIGEAFVSTGTFSNQCGTCPHCGTVAAGFSQELQHSCDTAIRYCRMRIATLFVGRCNICTGAVFGASVVKQGGEGEYLENRVVWPPETRADRAPKGLDAKIKTVYDEARAVIGLSPRASATLARRCLQQVIRDKLGIKKGRLFDEISETVKRDDLARPTKERLDHVRHIGNWGAHPIEDQSNAIIDVTPEEAAYTLEVLEMLFHDLYVLPAQATSMSEHIQTKKQGLDQPE